MDGDNSVPSVEAPSVPVADNQSFDLADKESGDVDNSLLSDDEAAEELDFGDGDDHKEDMVSFQIEESDMAIMETEKKEEQSPSKRSAAQSNSKEDKKDAAKDGGDKPATDKEEEG